MELHQKQIGQKIKKIRELKNYTQKHLADGLGLSQSAYSKIEMGESEISFSRLEKIAEIFEMKPEELITFDDNTVFNINTMNNPNGGNFMSQITYTISDNERRLYEQQNIEQAVQWTLGRSFKPEVLFTKPLSAQCISVCMQMYGHGQVSSGKPTKTLGLTNGKYHPILNTCWMMLPFGTKTIPTHLMKLL
jgi:transcriptional regulator with XRE-family HTH domain